MTDLWHDLRYGVRMLRKNPGFAPVAVILAIRIVLACGFGAALFCAPGRAAPNADLQPPRFRLPAVVAPLRYTVSLTVAPDQDTFTGQVDIDLNFKEATSVLWLNADKITVKGAALMVDGQTITAKVIAQPKGLVGFSFDQPVGPGRAKFHASYDGK